MRAPRMRDSSRSIDFCSYPKPLQPTLYLRRAFAKGARYGRYIAVMLSQELVQLLPESSIGACLFQLDSRFGLC